MTPSRSVRDRFGRALLPAIGLAISLAAAAAAAPADAVRPGVSVPGGDLPLTAEALSARIEAVRSDATLTPEARDAALSLYSATLDAIRSAETWEFKAKKYGRLAEEAGGNLERLKALEKVAPPDPADIGKLSTEALESRASDLRVAVSAKRAELDEIAQELQRRATRRMEIPARKSEIRRALESLRNDANALGAESGGEPQRARGVRASADAFALDRELVALEAELGSYDARRELLSLRRDVVTREIAALQAEQESLQDLIDERRQSDAERTAAVASGAEQAAADAHPILRKAAEENAALAAARTGPDGIVSRLERSREFGARIEARENLLAKNFAAVQERARIVGFTGPVGALLRKQKLELPDKSFHREKIRARQDEIGATQLRLIELEDERASLVDPAAAARTRVESEAPDLPAEEAEKIAAGLTALLEARRTYIDTLLADYDSYFLALVDLDTKERELLARTSEFGDFIDTHVLWIRSTRALDWRTLADATAAFAWLIRPENGARLLLEWRVLSARYPLAILFAVIAIATLFAAHRRLAQHLKELESVSAEGAKGSLRPLFVSTATTIAAAARWPLIFALLAWLISDATGDHARALSAGFEAVAAGFFLSELTRQICRRGGLGTAHLGWPEKPVESVRRYVTTAMIGMLPAAFLVSAVQAQPNEAWKESLGRIAYIVAVLSIGVMSFRVLRRNGPVLQSIAETERGYSPLYRARRLLGPLALLTCLFLTALAALGYYFAALSLAPHVTATVRLAFALALLQALVLRWLPGARHRLASVDASTPVVDDATAAARPGIAVTPADRRLVGNLTAVALVIGLFVIWSDVLPALNALNKVELWSVNASHTYAVTTDAGVETRTGTRVVPITVGSVLRALVLLAGSFAAARYLPPLLELGVLSRLKLAAGVGNAVTTLLGYVFVLFGVLSSAGTVGLSWSQVQWLAAAVSVGLGFGLQEIFANFVSGLILLFERRIRIGDTVTLGGVTGTVNKINIRATTIVDWENKELIVPNREFVTGQLTNWTLSDTTLRLTVLVGVAYGSDTKLVENLLLETARKNPNVLDDPPPVVVFSSFGDSALNFELRVFVPHVIYAVQARHQLHMKIDEAFRAAGIEIAFPQRDLHLRSVSAPVPVRIES
jgi:potassium efflux system protein